MRIGSLTIGQQRLSALDRTQKALARSLERLSSGKRVSSPADDAVAYSQSIRFDSQLRGISQGLLNIGQQQGVASQADSTIQSQLDIVYRMRELAVAATSSTLTAAERTNLKNQLQDLLSQYRQMSGDAPSTTSTQSLGIGSSADTDVFKMDVGTGMFDARKTLFPNMPYPLVATGYRLADLNNDGALDVMGYNAAHTTFTSFLNSGNGSFSGGMSATASVLTSGASMFELIDFNHDGKIDLVGSDATDQLYIMMGNGDGTFTPTYTIANAYSVTGLRVGDLNEDGWDDIIVVDPGNLLTIINNQGSVGSFTTTGIIGTRGDLVEPVITDINNDHHADIVVMDHNGGLESTMIVSLGNGSGAFTSMVTSAGTLAPQQMMAADVNRDGKMDIVAVSAYDYSVESFIGNGSGGFGSRVTSFYSNSVNRFDLADFNSDGILDVVIEGLGLSGVSFGTGTGAFGPLNQTLVGAPTRSQIFARDFDKDGVLDVLVAGTTTAGMLLYKGRSTSKTALSALDVSSSAKAEVLLRVLDSAISTLQKRGGEVTAVHSRLDFQAASQLLMQEALSDAKENLVSADLAVETAEAVRLQILQEAQIATQAHSISSMAVVLQLLGSVRN